MGYPQLNPNLCVCVLFDYIHYSMDEVQRLNGDRLDL
jgi:hypothetical protein